MGTIHRGLMAGAFALAITAGLTSTAQAATFFVGPGPVQPSSNVLFQSGSTTGPTVAGSLNDSPALVTFSSTSEVAAGGLNVTQSQGQARISGVDGDLTQLTISLMSGFSFSAIEFNLNAVASGFATLVFSGIDGTLSTQAITASGQNFFAATGNFNTVTISSTVQLADVRQIRVTANAVPAGVPEPATWAMMLVGFAGIGVSMRRRRPAMLRQAA